MKSLHAKMFYVHGTLAIINDVFAVQFAAEVTRGNNTELETFKYECQTEPEALVLRDEWTARVAREGHVLIISPKGF